MAGALVLASGYFATYAMHILFSRRKAAENGGLVCRAVLFCLAKLPEQLVHVN
jgi:hypothetical protein